MSKFTEIIVRDYDFSIDNGYIYSTWTKFSYYSSLEPIDIPKEEFFKRKIAEIDHHLEKGVTKIACLKEDPEIILGYITALDGKSLWLCIKKDFRKSQIEALLKKSIEVKHEES
jgi:hypothetical protein